MIRRQHDELEQRVAASEEKAARKAEAEKAETDKAEMMRLLNAMEELKQHLNAAETAYIEEIFKRLEAADLKMKRSKCDFFKKHIHYLGHLISADGIQPLKDKLDTICDMPAPCNSKEVKQLA